VSEEGSDTDTDISRKCLSMMRHANIFSKQQSSIFVVEHGVENDRSEKMDWRGERQDMRWKYSSDELNMQIAEIDAYNATGLAGCGGTEMPIPYHGWYWRDIRFDADTIIFAYGRGFVGFCEQNRRGFSRISYNPRADCGHTDDAGAYCGPAIQRKVPGIIQLCKTMLS